MPRHTLQLTMAGRTCRSLNPVKNRACFNVMSVGRGAEMVLDVEIWRKDTEVHYYYYFNKRAGLLLYGSNDDDDRRQWRDGWIKLMAVARCIKWFSGSHVIRTKALCTRVLPSPHQPLSFPLNFLPPSPSRWRRHRLSFSHTSHEHIRTSLYRYFSPARWPK